MIVTPDELGQILRGELTEVRLDVERPPKVGSVQMVQSKVGRRAPCSARILDRWRHRDGGWVVRFEALPRQEPARLLRRKGGYASSPQAAMKDSTTGDWDPQLGATAEPEAVNDDALRQYARDARDKHNKVNEGRRREYEAQSFIERCEARIMEAEQLGLSAERDMQRLEAALGKLERTIRLARQQRRVA